MLTTRTQLCPTCTTVIDNHTEQEMVECDQIMQAQMIWGTTPKTTVVRIHDSWSYRLPKEYQA